MKIKGLRVSALRNLLTNQNRAIIELWKTLPIPGQHLSDDDVEFANVPQHKKKVKLTKFSEETTRARSLRELHEKLDSLKGKRLVYKDKLVKKGLKNRLNKKKKKEENILKKKLLKRNFSATDHRNGVENVAKPIKQIFNEEGKLVFNKFDFSESAVAPKISSRKDKNEKDPRKILYKLEKDTEKLKDLESGGDIKMAQTIKEKTAWKAAFQKSGGIKVKDDPELLKKSMRKGIEKKRRSRNKWDARKERVKQQQQEKQSKRVENIQARKKQNKLNKLKRATKKGRIIPGF